MQKNNIDPITRNFPPVVAVLGHVDHGKTTLLDAIRRTSIASREYGGITQSIGASGVEIDYEGNKRSITFIDTPGHEAFSAMRSRGALAADIGLLIISAIDGIMPQTRESIHVLKSAQIPFITVLTFGDMPTRNPDKVKQQLLREDVMLEEFGGNVPAIEVSAKTGLNIKELLDLILLVAQMNNVNEHVDPNAQLKAIVIESKRDQRIGPKATVIIKSGKVKARGELFCEGVSFRVRNLISTQAKPVDQAGIGEAVEVIGMETVLPVGGVITDSSSVIVNTAVQAQPLESAEFIYHKPKDTEGLYLYLCADTQGSLEAIMAALPKEVALVGHKTGEITEADVLQAKAVGAIALCFNTKIRPEVQRLAAVEKVVVANYKIIYEMLDEIKDVLEGKRDMNTETILGKAKILAKFPYEKTLAYGINVLDGRMAKNDRVRLIRDEVVIGETSIHSLRQGKNPVPKIAKGEGGIVFTHPLDITIGDMVISYS